MSTSVPTPHQDRAVPPRARGWIEWLARGGYLAKAVVYALVGGIALFAALGSGGRVEGLRGALAFVDGGIGAEILLGVIAIGLAAYALWRLVAALADSESQGASARGLGKRAGYALSGIVHAGLAVYVVRLIMDEPTARAPGSAFGPRDWAALILSLPLGRVALGAAGLIATGIGLAQLRIAAVAAFREKLELDSLGPRRRTWAVRVGRLGIAARAAILGISGGFLVKAAIESDAEDARGFAGVLEELGTPSWHWLLASIGAGLIFYALYCLVESRYRRVGHVGTDDSPDGD